jgi:porin
MKPVLHAVAAYCRSGACVVGEPALPACAPPRPRAMRFPGLGRTNAISAFLLSARLLAAPLLGAILLATDPGSVIGAELPGKKNAKPSQPAQPQPDAAEAVPSAGNAVQVDANGNQVPSIATSLPYGGDPTGMRKWLNERGFTYGFTHTFDVLSNVSGGLQRGTVYHSKLETFVNADLEKLVGWKGLTFFSNQFQLNSNGGAGRDLVGNFNTISNIEALPTTRLSELWLEQRFFGDKVSVRFGQLAADSEFFISSTSQLFITSDWPSITALNLPSGAAAYPLSTPGVRLKIEPTPQWTLLAAVFNGDPSGPGPADAEIKNPHGVNFRLQDPPLLIGEVQYKYNQGKTDTGLAGILRLGGWYHTGQFRDQRFGTDGLSLANPASNGIARMIRGTSGIYGIIDQQLYRPAGGGPDSGIAVFSRISGSPSEQNFLNFYLDGGITFAGLLPGRPDDKFGATFLYSRISDQVRAFDRDVVFYSGIAQPVRSSELSLEFTYMAQIIPGWTVQPDFQYVFRPGGNVANPNGPLTVPIKNAAIFGVRSVVRY